MTYDKYLVKWSAYSGVLLLVYIVQFNVVGYIPFYSTSPLVFPLCAVMIGYFEGQMAGVTWGLVVGILCDAAFYDGSGRWTIGLALIGLLVGAASRYGLHQSLLGAFLSTLVGLVLVELGRVAGFAFQGTIDLAPVLTAALWEIVWSLVLSVPLYGLFHWVYSRVPKSTVL